MSPRAFKSRAARRVRNRRGMPDAGRPSSTADLIEQCLVRESGALTTTASGVAADVGLDQGRDDPGMELGDLDSRDLLALVAFRAKQAKPDALVAVHFQAGEL